MSVCVWFGSKAHKPENVEAKPGTWCSVDRELPLTHCFVVQATVTKDITITEGSAALPCPSVAAHCRLFVAMSLLFHVPLQ